jgi:hypothetical protein
MTSATDTVRMKACQVFMLGRLQGIVSVAAMLCMCWAHTSQRKPAAARAALHQLDMICVLC